VVLGQLTFYYFTHVSFVELLSKHSVAFPVILQDPPGSFSVNEEWN
jgi:hypothetical protein